MNRGTAGESRSGFSPAAPIIQLTTHLLRCLAGAVLSRERKLRRREFISLLSGAAASLILPVDLRVQQPAMTRVGIVTIQPRMSPIYAALSQRLRELGYIEGQNLALDFVNPAEQPEASVGAIKELIRRKVDIVLALYGIAFREWVDAGGLLSYGVKLPAIFRRAAEFVDMSRRGDKPAELRVEQPTKFELVINLKTARAIGITISPSILVRVDDVIE